MNYEELKKIIVACTKLAHESLEEARKQGFLTKMADEDAITKIASVLLEQRLLKNLDNKDLLQD